MNALKTEQNIQAVSMLCEGNSIRSIERITGVHRDTVMRLGVRFGRACAKIQDEKMRNLASRQIEVDKGDVWTFIALDAPAAVALNFAHYNFCKNHLAIRMTPAQAAGVESSQWTVAELVERCGE